MKRGLRSFAAHAWLLSCFALLLGAEARPQQVVTGPIEIVEESRAVSPPLWQIRSGGPDAAASSNGLTAAAEVEEAAWAASIRAAQRQTILPTASDPVLQQSAGPLVATTAGLNFDGISAGLSNPWAAPDSNGAVGANQFVEWVNARFAVYNKSTGALIYGPKAARVLWTSLGGPCATNNLADGIVEYDKAAQRWIITHHAATSTAGPYYQCVAVSQTSNATGSWFLYAFQLTGTGGVPADYLPDYPKLGVWWDAYYISNNLQDPNAGYAPAGTLLCAFDRSAMLTGAAATAVCFEEQISPGSDASLLPSDLDGAASPPAGSPNYFMNLGTNVLNLFKFHVDFVTPSNSTFTGPTAIAVASFSVACTGSNGVCIPQKATKQVLDSVSDRLMYRLAYRNFGSYESLVVNHAVNPSGAAFAGIRWYEIRNPGGIPVVYQQGTFSPDGISRWMGSIAMDKLGDIAVGYSVSSNTMFPGIRYTGRLASDPVGTLEAENAIMGGAGSQLPSDDRWGDYTSMSIDPTDDCTFWYTNEYLPASGTYNWHTRITSFKFTACQ